MYEVAPVVYDQFFRPEPEFEMNDGISEVETAGYIPAHIKIEEMIAAGMRLNLARREAFDGDWDDDDIPLDPTRGPNFDMADASFLAREVQDRLAKQKAAADSAKDNEKPAEIIPEVKPGKDKV